MSNTLKFKPIPDATETEARPVVATNGGSSAKSAEGPSAGASATSKVAEAPVAPGEARKPATGEEPAARPPEARAPQAAGKEASAPAKPRSRKRMLLGAAGAIALAAAAWYAYDYITVGQYMVSTDDAYVGADMAIISPKIPANVAEVPIGDNQAVKAGDVLVKLDDGDYALALAQAEAKLATQQAAIATFDAQIRAAEATAEQARAQLDAANANVLKAESDYERTKPLVDRDFTSKATLDAVVAARDTARAQVKANAAAIDTADANVALLKSQRAQAQQVAKELQVEVDKAKRDLSFTVIRAPFNGVVGNKSVQVGDYVTPGKRLAAVVPLDQVYVDANVKETQLGGVEIGQKARVRVDALDGAAFEGTVESLSPASGSQFSLLPPENATGNFTKIVQRVPVRIAVPAQDANGKLRPGLSVVVDIDTRTTPDKTQHASAASGEDKSVR